MSAEPEPLVLSYPFEGRWRAFNSPASAVPSHGSHAMGSSYAIDFVAVGEGGNSARRTWRSLLATEPPEAFIGFGQRILAPVSGTVVASEDGEPDHVARRSLPTLLGYLFSQRRRARAGARGLAGNHVVIAVGKEGPFVLLAHLLNGSLAVRVGQRVQSGTLLGLCGNSGNTTEPHVHVQVTDSMRWESARGVPLRFVDRAGREALPRNRELVNPGS